MSVKSKKLNTILGNPTYQRRTEKSKLQNKGITIITIVWNIFDGISINENYFEPVSKIITPVKIMVLNIKGN